MSNLLPPKRQKSVLKLYRLRFISVTLLVFSALAIVSAALVFPAFSLAKSRAELLTKSRDILAGRETSTIQKNLSGSIADINAHLAVFGEDAVASPVIRTFIDPVLEAKTKEVKLTEFVYSTDPKKPGQADVKIFGVGDNRAALIVFADNLREIPGISNVNVPIESFIKDQNVTFRVTATIALK